jgi:hypothetical protein
MWFIQNVSTGSWLDMISLAGGGDWFTYPTIAIDGDQDFYLGSTHFNADAYQNTIWDSYEGLGSGLTFVGQNVMESSAGTYTGIVGAGPQRWGDYNTMIYDANAIPPGGEGSWWSVEEISQGGSDQSTTWEALADPTPLPYFLGFDGVESECSLGAGYNCGVTVGVPYDVQPGDVLLVALVMGQSATTLPTLPSGWTLLSASNLSGSPQQISATVSGGTLTSWLAAHVYGNNEPSSYKFVHYNSNGTELGAMLVAYRGGNQNLSNYTGYGFVQNGRNSSFTIGAISPPGETELVDLIQADGGCDTPESYEFDTETLTAPSGSPTLAPETPLNPLEAFWLAADARVPAAGQSYGPYTLTESPANGCQNKKGAIWLASGVAIPE